MPGRPLSPYNTSEIFAFAPFKTKILKYSPITFSLPDELFFVDGFNSVELDFGDGAGFRSLAKGGNVSIYYATNGTKILTARLNTVNGTRLARCALDFERPKYYYEPDYTWQIEVDPVYENDDQYFGPLSRIMNEPGIPCTGSMLDVFFCSVSSKPNATVRVVNGCDGVFDRPIIVLEGFDPTNEHDLDEISDRYGSGPFIETIRGYGFDFVFVNFTRNTTYIENNAKVLEAVIEKVNDEKTGNFQNHIIGFSMGGLIARWCLRDMEDRNIPHDVDGYFSYDVPHQGANIPLGMQYIFREMVRDLPYLKFNNSLRKLDDAFKSPAARQMLVTYADYNNSPFNWFPNAITLDPLRAEFANRLQELGYPQQTRNFGIALGRGNNTANTKDAGVGEQFTPATPFIPGDNIFSGSMGFLLINAEAICNSVPENNSAGTIAYYSFAGQTFRKIFGIPILPVVTLRVRRIDYTGQYPYDDGQGSFEQTQKEFVQNWISGIGAAATTNGHIGHNFVSTVSALDLQNQNYGSATNWQSADIFFNIDANILNPGLVNGNVLTNPALSPFEAIITGSSDCGFLGCNAESLRDENGITVFPPNNNQWNHFHNTAITQQVARFIQRNILNAQPVDCAGANGICNLNPFISGPNTICTTAEYELSAFPNGTTLTWASQNGRLRIINGQGTPSVTFDILSTGPDVITVTITNQCGAFLTRTFSVYAGIPTTTNVVYQGEEPICYDQYTDYYFTINNEESGISYRWEVHTWNSNITVVPALNNQNAIRYDFQPEGSYSVWAVPTNACGEGNSNPFHLYVNPGWLPCEAEFGKFKFTVSPNPTNKTFNVELREEKPTEKKSDKKNSVDVILWNFNQSKMIQSWQFDGSKRMFNLDVSSVEKGQYILQIRKGKNNYAKQVVIN